MTATITKTNITPDTTLFMLTQEFAGYSLLDSCLGNMSVYDYAATGNDNGESLASMMTDYLRDGGVFLSEQGAEAAQNEMERGYAYKIEPFTCREVNNRLMEIANA